MDPSPTLHLISDPAPGYLLNMHFLNLTFSFSLSQEFSLLFYIEINFYKMN